MSEIQKAIYNLIDRSANLEQFSISGPNPTKLISGSIQSEFENEDEFPERPDPTDIHNISIIQQSLIIRQYSIIRQYPHYLKVSALPKITCNTRQYPH